MSAIEKVFKTKPTNHDREKVTSLLTIWSFDIKSNGTKRFDIGDSMGEIKGAGKRRRSRVRNRGRGRVKGVVGDGSTGMVERADLGCKGKPGH